MEYLKSLSSVFTDKLFFIPDYQRAYAWEKTQRQDMLDDLTDLREVRKHRPGSIHFTGTIVVKKGAFKGQTVHPLKATEYFWHEIIDGQQRLVTISILLFAIAQELKKTGPEGKATADEIMAKYILLTPQEPKLVLNGENVQLYYLESIIRGTPMDKTSAAERNMQDAFHEFSTYVSDKTTGLTNSEKQKWLEEMATLITAGMGFIIYEVNTHHEVSVIFETMNGRGKDLTQFEKVKNLLMYLATRVPGIDEDSQLKPFTENVNANWRYVLDRLEEAVTESEADEDQYLRFSWVMFPKAFWFDESRKDATFDIHRAIKESAKDKRYHSDPQEWLNSFVVSLNTNVVFYRDIINPDFTTAFSALGKYQDIFQEKVSCINSIGREANLIPLLMAAYKAYINEPENLLAVFNLIESFSFRMLLLGKYSQTGRSKAFGLAAEIVAGGLKAVDVISRIKNDLINYYAGDTVVQRAMLDDKANYYEWSGIRYFLFEYERFLARNQDFPFTWNEFNKFQKEQTIEHILPKGENTLQVAYWNQSFTLEEWNDYRHSLGNLTLCLPTWNSSLGNKSFPEKSGDEKSVISEKVYRNSTLLGMKSLIQWEKWTVQSIQERQKELVEFAMARWGVDKFANIP